MATTEKRLHRPRVSNNPAGRPKGAKNNFPAEFRRRLEDMVHDNFDDVVKDIKKLPAKEKIKYYIEFIKLVLPRPVNTEELEAIAGASRSALVAKLFLDGNGEG